MFGIATLTQLESVAVKVEANGPTVSRRVRIKLGLEFDFVLAAALGGDASNALLALKSKGISEVLIPMDAIGASGKMVAKTGEKVMLTLRGVRCKAKAGKKLDDAPTATMEFEMLWNRDAWIFFGENAAAWVEVNFKKEQLSLFPSEGERDDDDDEPRVS